MALVSDALGVLRWVWAHPSNRGERGRALGRAVAFQLRGRLLGRPTMVRLGVGGRMLVDLHAWGATPVVYGNPPDWPEMLVWRRRLAVGDLFVDVGANAGSYAVWAGDLGAEVIAVEPDPAMLVMLRRNVALNPFAIEVLPVVLAEAPGTVSFVSDGPLSHIGVGEGDEVTVAATTLDAVLGDRVAAGVKIDVEGAERRVLEGATRALAEHRIACLQLEWNAASTAHFGEGRQVVAALLAGHGYELHRPDPAGNLVPVGDDPPEGPDVFALPG